ncbi:MAG: HDOD domain-containing protein [Candidatus Competibacter sp.]|nr:HDOD domain-containing protein [Candidatus Competibacter sp.]MDG4584274.1 HDOD domain-containing protein [Candidatus Competibacter sp.]
MPAVVASHIPFDSTDLLALPVLPAVVGELLEAFESTGAGIQKLARLTGYDAILSARMLAVANSASCRDGTSRRANLESALAALGVETAKSIVATTAIHQSLTPLRDISASALDRFWLHSLTCAHLARRLAVIIDYSEPEEAYLCGLLHDLGKLVIGVRHGKAFTAMQEIRHLARSPREIPELEQRLFDTDHCELGAALVETWRLPSFLADAIRFHHLDAGELRGVHPLPRLLHVANALSQEEDPQEETFVRADSLLGLNRTLLRQARFEAEREVINLAADLGIDMSVAGGGRKMTTVPGDISFAQAAHERILSDGAADRVDQPDTQSALLEAMVAQDRLGQAVHERALMNEARGEIHGADSEPALAQAIARCATILFDIAEVCFFVANPETGTLRCGASEEMLRQIAVDPNGSVNSLSRALREQRICHSLDAEIAVGVIDRQLSRLWGTDGVLCLPLSGAERPLGVLAMGISRAQLQRLLTRTRLLRLFAIAVTTEIDPRRQREANRQRAQNDRRLLERQQLRAALHEIANPLTIMRNYFPLLEARLEKQAARDELKVLQEETERIGRILRRLSEPGGAELEDAEVNLNKTVQGLASVLDDALCRPHGISLKLSLADALPVLPRGRDTIRQILLNLIRNAAEALGQGGTITVSTQNRINLHGRQYVEIAVADTGPGLPDHWCAKIFQPVASTKGDGHAGLGLAIVKNLTDQLGGQALCRPNGGGGSIFTVLLPLA